jgi:hypothetical protein
MHTGKQIAIGAMGLLLPCMTTTQQAKTTATPRYAYVTSCFGALSRIDLVLQRELTTVELQSRTKLIPSGGDTAKSSVDGCAIRGAAYVPATGLLYTLAPTTGAYRPGGRYFRLLWLHLPEASFAGSSELPNPLSEEQEAALGVQTADNGTVLVHAGGWLQFTGEHFASTAAPEAATVAGVKPQQDGMWQVETAGFHTATAEKRTSLTGELLQQSGATSLLWLPGESALALSSSAKTLALLQPGFPTTQSSVQLSPGGEVVVAQEAKSSNIGVPITGTRVALIDASDGKVTQTWNDTTLSGTHALFISPNGSIVFFGKGHFRFLKTAHTFPNMPVRSLASPTLPEVSVIFAAR